MVLMLFKQISIIFYVVIFICLCFYAKAKYDAMTKYYPGLSFIEYLLLHDVLRITPDEK
jgi:hypothetical protein